MALAEEAEEELELCEAIFTEEELTVSRRADGATVALALRPNTCDDESQLFVMLTLVLTLGPEYPEHAPPSMAVPVSKGLDDAQLASLMEALQELVEESPGEPIILGLSERVKEFLDEHNTPPQECSICLEPLAGSADGETGDGELLRLDCFHCFHVRCAARWRLSVLASAEALRQANPHAHGRDAIPTPEWLCPVRTLHPQPRTRLRNPPNRLTRPSAIGLRRCAARRSGRAHRPRSQRRSRRRHGSGR